jgi:hypothetical protein
MKNITSFFVLIFVSLLLNAQVMVAPTIRLTKKMPEFTPQQLSKLKATTTYFIIKDQEEYDPEDIKNLIKDVWTVTPFEVATISEFFSDKLYEHDEYSFFTISGLVIRVTSKSGTSYLPYTFLELWMNSLNKKGKKTEQPYARIDLFADYPTVSFMVSGQIREHSLFVFGKGNEYEGMSWMEYFYTKSKFQNYRWPLIKNYLRDVNECLADGKSKGFFETVTNSGELEKLKTQPLYLPDYALIKTNIFTKSQSPMDKAEFTAKYPYPVKVTTIDELCEQIDNAEEPFYYMIYVRSNTDKFITIFNSETCKPIYHRFMPSGWNMKSGDMKDLGKIITKPPKE